MNSINKTFSSCSKCLEKAIELQDPSANQEGWDLMGRGLSHCEMCIKALKEDHSQPLSSSKAKSPLPIKF